MIAKPSILIFTGGHHTSGLAVAKKLLPQIKIIWFGHRFSSWGDKSDSAEYQEVTKSKIEFINLNAGKFHRTYHPLKLPRIPWGFIQAGAYLLNLKSKYHISGIVSFGGYLAVPVVIMGKLMGIKSITYEQTLVTGWANKLISKFCDHIALAWPQSQKYFPNYKTSIVGLPIRDEILSLKSQPKNAIYITGGKQGSHLINSIIFKILPKITKKYLIIHQTGSNSLYHDYEYSQSLKFTNYTSFPYAEAEETAKYLQQAKIVISRSGAHIIAELLYFQKPCVLIPIPWVSHNEQQKNAEFLASQNLAVILPQSELTPKNLLKAIDQAQKLTPKSYQLNYNGIQNLTNLIISKFNV